MCHNGRTYTSEGSVIPLTEKSRTLSDREGNGAPVTELVAERATKTWGVGSLWCNPNSALVVFLEYIVRPDQSGRRLPGGEPTDESEREAWIDANTSQVTVVVGCSQYLPWDGKRFRLRSSFDPRLLIPVDGSPNKFELPLEVDTLTCTLSTQRLDKPLVWPAPGVDELLDGVRGDRDKAMRYVQFTCSAFTQPPRESSAKAKASGEKMTLEKEILKDETPLPGDERDVEEEEKEFDENSDSSDSSGSDDSEDEEERPPKVSSPKRRTKRHEVDVTSLGATITKDKTPESPSTPRSLDTADSDLWFRSGIVPRRPASMDTPEPSPREERHTNFGRQTSSLLAQTLQAPLGAEVAQRTAAPHPTVHFGGDVPLLMPSIQPPPSLQATNAFTVGNDTRVHELSRASRARMDMTQPHYGGRSTKFVEQPPCGVWGAPNLALEMADSNCLNAIFIGFVAFRGLSSTASLPQRLSFSFRFFDKAPRRTPCGRIGETKSSNLDNSKPHPIIFEGGAGGPGLEERISVDVSEISTAEALDFFKYLGNEKLQIDVWDGDALILLGTAFIALRPLLREQKNSVQVALEYDVSSPQDSEKSGQTTLIGRLQLSLTNYGGKGKAGVAGGSGPVRVAPVHEPVGPFNWRFVNNPDVGTSGSNEGSRPAHRKRARPLIDAGGKELKHAVNEVTKGKGGGITNSGSSKWSEGNTITYEELSSLSKRFRVPNMKGYVGYRGPLIQLLDAPSVIVAEKSLVADLTKLEERGGRSLESIIQLLDRNQVGYIASDDLLIGLKSLCPSSFGKLRSREANMLAGRIERDAAIAFNTGGDYSKNQSNHGIPVLGVVNWVRARQGEGDIPTKLERLFRVFEKASGVPASSIMQESPNASDFTAAVRSMQQTIGPNDVTSGPNFLTDSALHRFVDKQGDKGHFDVTSWLTQRGLYVPEEKVSQEARNELKAALSRVTEDRLPSLFESWLVNDSSMISVETLINKLSKKFGLVRRLSLEKVQKAVLELDKDEDGFILCSDLFYCVGWSWDKHIEKKLLIAFTAIESQGNGLAPLIEEEGEMTPSRLKKLAMNIGKPLPVYITDSDLEEFLAKLKNKGMGLLDFAKQEPFAFGEAKLKRLLLSIEASGTVPIHQIFQNMDKDGNGILTHDELMEGLKQGLKTAEMDEEKELTPEISQALRGLGRKALQTNAVEGVSLREFMDIVDRPFANYLEARLEAIIRISKIDIGDIFKALDKDGDGTVNATEMGEALKKIKGFEDAKDEDVKELLSRFDPDNSGTISLAEFSKVMGHHFRAADTEAMFVKLMGRAVKLGFSLRQCFDELDHSGDGEVDAEELLAGLNALGASIPMFQQVDSEDIGALVSHISGGQDVVTRDAFLSWGKKHKLGDEEDLNKAAPIVAKITTPPPKKVEQPRRIEQQSQPEQSELGVEKNESKGNDDDDDEAESKQERDPLSSEYSFSSDPFTASAERKLRRVAQTFQSRAERLGGWCDVEELFTRYDKQGRGIVLKSEFVNILMQLGLSLVDIPTDNPAGESSYDNERRRRLMQISRVKGGLTDMTTRLKARTTGGGGVRSEGGDEEEIALIKWYREGQKKGMVRNMVESGVKSEYHIFPRFGASVFFEHPLVNPFNGEERLLIEIEGSGLRLVSDFEEWVHCRRHLSPPPGFPPLAVAIEPDMFAVDRGGVQLLIGAHETVPLPLSFLSVSEVHMSEEHTCVVKLISAKHGVVVAFVEVHIHPRAPIVHRTLRFSQGEGSIAKRHIKLPQGVSGKFIAPIEFGERRVVVESRVSGDGCQEIGIKYAKLGPFPSTGDFYLLIFDDEYRSKLYELWHVVVSSRLRKNVHGAVGTVSNLELVVRGDRQERVVRAYSSNPSDICFNPENEFVLHPGVYNQVILSWLPKEAGAGLEHVHLVDTESSQLVAAYLLSTVATPPQVSKEFDVDVVVGEPSHKRVSYCNPWSRAQAYTLRSSDPNRMRPKANRLHIEAHGQAYIRLFIAPVAHPGISEVFLLVNDEQGQNDECFRIVIRADR